MDSTRPNRSDVHLNGEEAAKVEEATRHYFDDLAPKRHTKPQRSEHSSAYVDTLSSTGHVIPEYEQFQHLEKEDIQKLVYSGNKVAEEFMETEYYRDLSGIDKQHHTTGTGFIKVDNKNGEGFSLAPDSASECHPSCKGNPATNEWTPAANDKVDFISGKPKRSG
ncbi:hypothetical protein CDL12_28819 [Handroanthus impetiginosus]|uniref:Maternal effect embryo arrest 59 n=1 Tax=Handroanthus impetiginosus TaxID=429701 RepID=A0A2G9G1C3_9LAMI|nr:hypothetical protein CDL12_28819 [Handroanthus impetiginosus]